MTIQDSTTYETLRESILQYDQATIKWSSTMALGSNLAATGDGPAPMEVDRIWKGKGQGKHKGKNDKGKGYEKGWEGKGKNDGKGGKTKMLMGSLENPLQKEKENLERARVRASSAGNLDTWQRSVVFDLSRRQMVRVVTMLRQIQLRMQQMQQLQTMVQAVAM